jgi:hypothetical protein
MTNLPLQNTEIGPAGVDDMCQLSYLHEPAILENLRRFVIKFCMPSQFNHPICSGASIIICPIHTREKFVWLSIHTSGLIFITMLSGSLTLLRNYCREVNGPQTDDDH